MTLPQRFFLQGRRVLLVEDTFLIAEDITKVLRAHGAEVIGPVGRVRDAIALATTEALDAAIVDINLHGEMSYPAVDALRTRHVPVVFATGYDLSALPEAYRQIPRWEKPFDYAALAEALPALCQPPRSASSPEGLLQGSRPGGGLPWTDPGKPS